MNLGIIDHATGLTASVSGPASSSGSALAAVEATGLPLRQLEALQSIWPVAPDLAIWCLVSLAAAVVVMRYVIRSAGPGRAGSQGRTERRG